MRLAICSCHLLTSYTEASEGNLCRKFFPELLLTSPKSQSLSLFITLTPNGLFTLPWRNCLRMFTRNFPSNAMHFIFVG